ncbi:LCP family glycopolymer transferase [Fundicoccus sp. Sow4_H7]|uniref:LCP family glycopolymer transferase n=1 Tax=Fundicoccus sp. Sow4_H7 TaxID=3438784 RepID=UPI003F8E3FBD
MKKLFKKKSGKISFLKIFGWLVLFTLIIVGGFAIKVYQDIQAVRQSITVETVEVENLREDEVSIEEGEPLNILLIGTDDDELARNVRDGYVGRSDTLMMITLNPQNRTTKFLSIPRDALAMVEGSPDKINHAYAYGGAELTIETVQDFLGVPIDYYAVVNMSGLMSLIDAVGGIEVTSPLTFEYRGTGFVKGETREVNGVKAMNFARMRYDDPEGEIGRQNRQKIVVKAVIDKLLSFDTITTYPEVLKVVSQNVRTNFDIATALNIYQNYLPALENISAIQFSGMEETYINEVFYFHIPISSRLQIGNEIRQQLSLSPLVASDLFDPLDSDQEIPTTKVAIIFNQYPTGVSQEETDRILAIQQEAQQLREYNETEPEVVPDYLETYRPPVSQPTYPPESYNPPESSYNPPETSQPPVEQPSEPELPPVSEPEPPVSEPEPPVSEPEPPASSVPVEESLPMIEESVQ